ncbi:MAG: hypothetical protein ACLQUY_26845 [Ktedonobacterales bacterium]
MNDDDFVHAFLSGALPNTSFHHRDHLRLAWSLIHQQGEAAAIDTITTGIKRFAHRHGHDDKYNETLTQFWVRIVSFHIEKHPDIKDFEHFLNVCPQLLDKELPCRHWRRETMGTPVARTQWAEPDLLALPR